MTAPPPGPHGGDAWRLASALDLDLAEVLDLSASLNPLAPDVRPIVARHLDDLRHYPDDGRATAALAETLDVDADRVVLTNGGAEAIALVAAEWPVGRVDQPDFSLYARHLTRLAPDAPRWRSDPHNPTGRLADPDDRAAVRDEAFYPLATGRWSRGDADAVALGSLTKVFACPGLRLGYVVAPDDEMARAIRARRPRWTVNALAAAALPELLGLADLTTWRDRIAELRGALVELLAEHQFVAEASAANYVWVPEARGLRDRLAACGVLIRSGESFGAPDAARIAVPGPDDLTRLATALDRTAP